ncbi:hypothetical protein [Tardiphaga sp.]|uniref:hypothetical protein n=1 Tax=Tardiphaga sp. TaxID=1926292 RepID=UPI00262AC338|nr:hypothetical protein [Tardiphaga sp.]MDB5616041.1 hypothetical protein [Tardiphaga sp.]
MPTAIAIDEKVHSPGLYDSANGVSLVAERVVDITDDCPSSERTMLLYTRAKRGPIVQIVHPYDNQQFMGSAIHFFINEIEPGDPSFDMTARRAGLDPMDMFKLVERLSPPA